MTPEQTAIFEEHNPYAYNEIIQQDAYRLDDIAVPPRVIFDIGANVGIFTAAVKDRWPEARVVAVEPHPESLQLLSQAVGELPAVDIVPAALARESVYFQLGENLGGNIYRCGSVLDGLPDCGVTDVAVVMLDGLAERFGQPDLVKIDIEGAEFVLIDHPPSHAVLEKSQTVAIELHPYGKDRTTVFRVGTSLVSWLGSFFSTHDLDLWIKPTSGMAWLNKRI